MLQGIGLQNDAAHVDRIYLNAQASACDLDFTSQQILRRCEPTQCYLFFD